MAKEKPASLKNLTLLGKEHLPSGGGFLILPNQLHQVDLLRLETILEGRRIVCLVEEGAALHPLLRAHLEQENVHALAVVLDDANAGVFRKEVTEKIDKGAVIIYLPAEAAAINACASNVPGAKLDFLLKADVPVLPLYVQHSTSIALDIESAYDEGDVIMAFGGLLQGEDLTLPAYQEVLFVLAEQCFSAHRALNMHLAYALIRGFKKHGTRNVVVDGKDDKELGFDKILAVAIALSKNIKADTSKRRVGIILPPGAAGLIANVAVLLAGKIPVNLNFTAGRAAVEYAIKSSDIDRFITADIFVRKMQSFPWPPMRQLLLIERTIPLLKSKIALWLGLSKVLPAAVLAAVLGVPRKGGNQEALLLFTSGSSGNPKGVALTHRNIMSNVIQF
ncbi:MAG: AMP-binding protein, partial [Prosthecobacter sp.]|nr:AMP-binding protein [Prosthecobacter sp.]